MHHKHRLRKSVPTASLGPLSVGLVSFYAGWSMTGLFSLRLTLLDRAIAGIGRRTVRGARTENRKREGVYG